MRYCAVQQFILACLVGLMLFGVLRLALWVLRGVGLAWIVAAACLIAGWHIVQRESAAPSADSAAYRAAGTAVERATGRPCDYACRVRIADASRDDVAN
jgi:hypothetical protein